MKKEALIKAEYKTKTTKEQHEMILYVGQANRDIIINGPKWGADWKLFEEILYKITTKIEEENNYSEHIEITKISDVSDFDLIEKKAEDQENEKGKKAITIPIFVEYFDADGMPAKCSTVAFKNEDFMKYPAIYSFYDANDFEDEMRKEYEEIARANEIHKGENPEIELNAIEITTRREARHFELSTNRQYFEYLAYNNALKEDKEWCVKEGLFDEEWKYMPKTKA